MAATRCRFCESGEPARERHLCKECVDRRVRKKDPCFCLGGCGKKTLAHFVMCGGCSRAGVDITHVSTEAITAKRPRSTKRLRQAEEYYRSTGIPIPWADKPKPGSWG